MSARSSAPGRSLASPPLQSLDAPRQHVSEGGKLRRPSDLVHVAEGARGPGVPPRSRCGTEFAKGAGDILWPSLVLLALYCLAARTGNLRAMDIHQSIDEILESHEVLGEVFYRIFWQRCPEVQKYFAGVDMQRQAGVLSVALLLVEQFDTYGYPAVARYLRDLGRRHQQRRIPPALYLAFRDALLAALAEHHGADWSEQLERQWRQAIDRAASVMQTGYM